MLAIHKYYVYSCLNSNPQEEEMKDERAILIMTETEEANVKVGKMLHDAGFTCCDGQSLLRSIYPTHNRQVYPDKTVSTPVRGLYPDLTKKIRGGNIVVYHHSELTPELVAGFPGARELKPEGPFKRDNIELVVDGERRRIPCIDEYFLTDYEDDRGRVAKCEGAISVMSNKEHGQQRWILRPLISEEKQAALDRLTALEGESAKLRTALDAME
jgi:hypothetical protein